MEGLGMSTFKHTVKTASSEAVSLSVTYSGHEKCGKDHRWGKGIREQYILHLIVSGKGTYVTPKGSYSLSSGDMFLIRPRTEIEYFADENEPWEYYWVNFTGEDAEYILKRTDFTEENPVIRNCGEDIFHAMEDILESAGNERYKAIGLTGRLYILLSLLVKGSKKKASPRSSAKCFKTARDYISGNYPLPISVEDIAEAAGVSRATLFRIFKAEVGVSPVDYLISYRINKAKRLLNETDLSVTAVARSVGYEDNLYFSRAFKGKTGVSPSEYKKRTEK